MKQMQQTRAWHRRHCNSCYVMFLMKLRRAKRLRYACHIEGSVYVFR